VGPGGETARTKVLYSFGRADRLDRPATERQSRSAPNDLGASPLLLLLAGPTGRFGGTSGQLPGTLARIGEDRVDQPRH